MSGMVECYLINEDGLQCDFSPAVTNTRVIFGKNQPFLCVEIEVSKYMFDSNDFWAERPHPEGTDPLARPNLTQNTTPVHIRTYGGEYDLIYTQTLNPNESTYIFLCYTKMWQSKTTEVASLIGDIVWSGQENTYDSGVLSVTCNGLTSLVQIAGAFLPTDGAGATSKNIQIVKPSKLNTFNVPAATKTNIGSLRVLVPIYVDPDIPSDALVGYTEPTEDISFENIQGTMRADTVYASILFDYSAPFSKQDLESYYKGAFPNLIIPNLDAYIYHASTKVQQNVAGAMVESSSAQLDGILYCQGVEYVTGYGQTLFAWLSNAIGGYNGEDLVIDKGYQMDTSENILSQLDYTTEELAEYKADTEGRIYGDSIYKIIPDTICYDLIKAVSVATNRHAYFADAPYLSSFEVSDFKPNSLSDLKIQYTPNDGSYAAYFIPYGETEPQQIILGSGVEYNDQGSTYLVGEQTARSANASVTVKATDAGTDIAGMPVEVSIDTESIEGSKEILAQVAFNTLVENYHPSNTLSFIALENSSTPVTTDKVAYMTRDPGLPQASDLNEGKYYIRAGYDDVGLYLSNGTGWTRTQPTTGETVTVYAPSNVYYFSFNGTSWDEYTYQSLVERHALFRPDTRCATLEDTRSHTTLNNVSLAYTVLSWPDCTTKYMFGDPVFQDTEETIAELQAIAKQSITNTSVSEALNKPYVTAAIGNMPLDQAGDDLTDFSGLILQKNDSTGVASLDGYMGGQRQARFSSDGSISSGVVTYHSYRSSDPTSVSEAGDSVIMDRDGFHTRSWHLYPTTAPQFAYSDGYWVEETRIGVDGEISAGAGSVVLGHEGLTNYDADGEPAYTLDDEGLKYKGQSIINSENGKIQLKVDGAAIDGNLRAISITLPYVQIDNEGLRTFSKYYWDTDEEQYEYYVGDLQCSVGTNGVITAGAGAVKLDATGLSTWSGQVASTVLGGWDYSYATKQCAVTTSGELIAGANLYKLDASGLSYNFGQGTGLINWQNILRYNATEHRVELYPSIYVEAAEIESLSADKITSGTLRATTAITCAGTISTGNGSVVMNNTSLSTYDVSVPSAPVLQCSIGADGVITAGTTKISNSGLITYYNNAVSTVISNQGRVAIGGGGQQSISIDGGLIKFYGAGSTIATDGTVSGTLGAYITSDGTINGLATNSVHTTQIEDNAVTDAKINTLSAGKIRTGELAVDVELKLTNTGSALLAGPAQTTGGTNYWKVRLDNTGLTTYTQGSTTTSVVPVCTIGADGNINGVKVEAANIKAGTLSSSVIYAGNISANQINTGTLDTSNVTVGNGSVILNSTGMQTYDVSSSPSTLQCSIGTDGAITAGANTIKISETGITVGVSSADAPATVLSMSESSYIEIIDNTIYPAVQIGASGAYLKNGIKTDSFVTSISGYKCGKYNAGMLPGTVTIETSVNSQEVQENYSSLVVFPSTRKTIGTFDESLGVFTNTYISYPDFNGHNGPAFQVNPSDLDCSLYPSSGYNAWHILEGRATNGYIQMNYDSTRKSENWPKLTIYQYLPDVTGTPGVDLLQALQLLPYMSGSTLNYTPISEVHYTTPIEATVPTEGEMYESIQSEITYMNYYYAYIYDPSQTSNPLIPALFVRDERVDLYTLVAGEYILVTSNVLDPDTQYYTRSLNTYTALTLTFEPTSSDPYYIGHTTYETTHPEISEGRWPRYSRTSATSITTKSSTNGKVNLTHILAATMSSSRNIPEVIRNTSSLTFGPNAVYLTGLVPGSIAAISYNVRYSLAQSLKIYPVQLGAFYASNTGSLIVSEGGLYGTTRIPTGVSGNEITFTDYTLSPLVNQTYLSTNIAALYATGLASTSASTTGVRNILLVGYSAGSQPSLPQTAREGDIVMCYRT